MAELSDTYRRRADAFAALIEGTPPQRWSSLSPCAEWRAIDVVGHVVDYSGHVLQAQLGMSDVPTYTTFEDPAGAFAATRQVLERLLDDPTTPWKVASHLHWSLSFDLPQHGWDLAAATGQDSTMDPAEVDLLWGSLNGAKDNWAWQRANGWYGSPVAVPEDAPLQHRVLGLLGRDPTWKP